MQKITPCLWFNHNGEEAVNFYISVFKSGKILSKSYYLENMHGKEGDVLMIDFELFGQRFMALNGGPQFPFTNAVSMFVDCKNQEEIDYYWDALLKDGGKPQECSWLTDKYGLSWQIAPHKLTEMIRDKNQAKASAAMQAMMKMVKIDMKEIQRAYDEA